MACLRTPPPISSRTSGDVHGVTDAELGLLASAAVTHGLGDIDPLVQAVRRAEFDLIFQSAPAARAMRLMHGTTLPLLVCVADNDGGVGRCPAAWRQIHQLLPWVSLAVVHASVPTLTTYRKIVDLAKWCRSVLLI